MSLPLTFTVSYAGIPLLCDVGENAGIQMPGPDAPYGQERDPRLGVQLQQRLPDLIDELNRLIPFQYLQDFAPVAGYPGRNLSAIAMPAPGYGQPMPNIRIGDWYYPVTASRWSVYRGLATATMVKSILTITQGNAPAIFRMEQVPLAPGTPLKDYVLESSLYMLPPRPLANYGDVFDGLYLITLVDERYWWQYAPESSFITFFTNLATWEGYVAFLATTLGVQISFSSPVADAYTGPEPDSQFWVNMDSAAAFLDACAYNVGSRVVRNLDGTYVIQRPEDALSIVDSNRSALSVQTAGLGVFGVSRLAGGNLFGGNDSKVGDTLLTSRNSILPNSVNVTFPMYIAGDDPVPHFSNPRNYGAQRMSAWYEDVYGDIWIQNVPIANCGPLVAGLTGVQNTAGTIGADPQVNIPPYVHYVHDTAKQLADSEATNLTPTNLNGLTNLATQIATDYYSWQVGAALDEVYPGTYAWQPEGYHDIVWTFSTRQRVASTRVMRTHWNLVIREMQHTTPPPDTNVPPITNIPKGVGGHTVAQTIRDGFYSGSIQTLLGDDIDASGTQITFSQIDNFPTQNRWRGVINSGAVDQEYVLFEGTSGGIGNPPVVDAAWRGIDGSVAQSHGANSIIQQVAPNTTYGVNLVSYEKGQFAFPQQHGTLGITGLNVLPQTQTVFVYSQSGVVLNGIQHFSGAVTLYDATQTNGSQWPKLEPVWLVERNSGYIQSGALYDGQLVGFSPSNLKSGLPAAPIYALGDMRPGLTVARVTHGATDAPIVSGVRLLRFDEERFNLSGFQQSGTVDVFWRGIKGYADGAGPLGPEPDIEIDGDACVGGSKTIAVALQDDQVNKKLIYSLNTIGTTGTFTSPYVKSVSFNSSTCVLTVTTGTITIVVNCGLVTSVTLG